MAGVLTTNKPIVVKTPAIFKKACHWTSRICHANVARMSSEHQPESHTKRYAARVRIPRDCRTNPNLRSNFA